MVVNLIGWKIAKIDQLFCVKKKFTDLLPDVTAQVKSGHVETPFVLVQLLQEEVGDEQAAENEETVDGDRGVGHHLEGQLVSVVLQGGHVAVGLQHALDPRVAQHDPRHGQEANAVDAGQRRRSLLLAIGGGRQLAEIGNERETGQQFAGRAVMQELQVARFVGRRQRNHNCNGAERNPKTIVH